VSVLIRPVGGLGNQLFIWAAGYALSRKKDVPLVCDRGYYLDSKHRHYELDSFNSGIQRTVTRSQTSWQLKRRLSKVEFASRWIFREHSTVFDPRIHRVSSSVSLLGYFHDFRYFSGLSAEIRERVTGLSAPSAWFAETRQRLAAQGPFLAVQVRRGDYVSLPSLGVLPEAYYRRAFGRLQERRTGTLPVFVFSDQPETSRWVRPLAGAAQVEVIHPPPESKPIESLVLMSTAREFITANSTFGWWAGYLGQMDAVIHPEPWFRNPSHRGPHVPGGAWEAVESGLRL
jgi:hypothetical protein